MQTNIFFSLFLFFFFFPKILDFSSAWQNYRGAAHRPSVHHPLTQVSQKLLHGSSPNFMESSLSIISPGRVFLFCFFLLSKFSILKFLRFVSFSLTLDLTGAKISKRHSYNFHPFWAKLYDIWGSHGRIKSYKFFGHLPKNLKFWKFWTLWNFNMKKSWENCKICNLLKTADLRAKRTNIWD